MKKIHFRKTIRITIVLIAIIFTQSVTAQVIELEDKYFVNLNKVEDGKDTIEIKEYTDFDFYKLAMESIENGDRGWLTAENYDRAFKSEVTVLKQGNYRLTNKKQKFDFSIDQNSQFTGAAKLEETDRHDTYQSNFLFSNGKVKSVITSGLTKNFKSTIIFTDSIATIEIFKDGILESREIIKNGGGTQQSIATTYYKNGNVETETDNIRKTFKLFYENGKPQRYSSDATKEWISYDEAGRKTEHNYVKDGQRCEENHRNGVIYKKTCRTLDNSEETVYHYQGGKLQTYDVIDHNTFETKTYDSKKKLINSGKSSVPPTISL